MAGPGRKLVLDLLGQVRFHVPYLFFFSGEGVKEDSSGQHKAADDMRRKCGRQRSWLVWRWMLPINCLEISGFSLKSLVQVLECLRDDRDIERIANIGGLMPVPQARFTELLADIEPSATTKSRASGGHSGIREHLRTQEQFKNRYVSSFLSGSYARSTSIRPRTSADGQERPDVDIIIVTNFSTSDHPDDVLNEVCRALEDGGEGYEVERINKRSVRVETWQADMDIVPVVQTWNGYMIPDRDNGTWKFTNPPVHTSWSAEQNERFGGRFKPLVKLFKWWRRINPSGRRPKGFVLEKLVSLHAPISQTHYGEAFAQLLKNIYDAYGYLAAMDQKPFIADPADQSNDILGKVTLAQWKDFVEKVRVYADIARRAQVAEDMEEATRQWRRVFGDRFKATANVAKAAAYGGFATAAPVAAGYTFPNAMAAPANKPRGFA